jgi:UvrD-like helicase C-terminal domain
MISAVAPSVEPLVHLRNDYQRGLWNGSTGFVRRIDRAQRRLIGVFEEEERTFEPDELVDLALGYALTCHKSQGSEATTVIVAFPYHPLHLLPREQIDVMSKSLILDDGRGDGEFHARAASSVARYSGIKTKNIDALGS